MSVLKAESLRKSFRRGGLWGGGSIHKAVDNVSFELKKGETLAIVGESGSGKSTTARIAMRLLEPDGGAVELLGEEISAMRGKPLRMLRKHIQMVFQDPFASLNPRMKIVETVGEGLRVHNPELNKADRRAKAAEVLNLCGMGEESLDRYPHQFSGGQRQRIGIARALVVEPKVLVLDEPVSALDVSVQAQILNLLKDIQQQRELSYLFISHDLSVVRHVADRVMVMFAGRVVEQGTVSQVFETPKHPYTKMLLAARPIDHPGEREQGVSIAEANEGTAETGCPYRLRCPNAGDGCTDFDGSDQSADHEHAYACLYPVTHD
ncbi:MAG TPA: oligopeptide/dipeptide ABC transporter ATP-binding protein [Mariprofundaceae bacterium]|nr:oligopeptide/dipeptide ABC transporter ATP-binding protein [Mariprofundaceae bacterium]